MYSYERWIKYRNQNLEGIRVKLRQQALEKQDEKLRDNINFYQQWNGPIKFAFPYKAIVYAMENNKRLPHLTTWMNVIDIT